MTANQIAYWTLQEQIRSNKAKEEETHRSNTTDEGLRKQQFVHTVVKDTADRILSEVHSRRKSIDDAKKTVVQLFAK